MSMPRLSSALWVPDRTAGGCERVESFLATHGSRAATLARLEPVARDFGFSIPRFAAVSLALTRSLLDEATELCRGGNANAAAMRASLQRSISEMLTRDRSFASVLSAALDTTSAPLVRASCAAEGLRGLSFAGVCRSVFPSSPSDGLDWMTDALATALASRHEDYGDYYLNHHGVPAAQRNVAIMFMLVVPAVRIYGVAYVFAADVCHIRYRYEGSPGGKDILVDGDVTGLSHWIRRMVGVLRALYENAYPEPVPIDVEFIVDASLQIHVVQVRHIGKAHVDNWLSTRRARTLTCTEGEHIGRASMPHRVGFASGHAVYVPKFAGPEALDAAVRLAEHPVLVFDHGQGATTLQVLRALKPVAAGSVSAIIGHAGQGTHDHLQYAVFEDRRFAMLVHMMPSRELSHLHGMPLSMVSNGWEAWILHGPPRARVSQPTDERRGESTRWDTAAVLGE